MEDRGHHLPLHQQQQEHNNVSFHLPAIVSETPHRETFVQISPMPDNTLLVVGQDGLVSVWTPDLKLKKSRCILDENKQQNRTMKWISDFTLMPQFNKLIVGTCDREIRLYEISNFEPYCQIVGLDTMPLHLGYSLRDTDECVIYFGDEQGCVNIILISHMAETLRNWTKCQVVDEIPSIAIENIAELNHITYIRWKVHNDWVTQIRYVRSIESIISSSNDDYTALIIGCVEGTKNLQKRLKDIMESGSVKSKRSMMAGNVPPKRNISDESVFKVKRGVKTFDFSKEAKILVTGGLDRIVRMWNPYVPGWPTGTLRGHSSPITYLQVADENTKIFSVSTDCTVMVWDIENHTCLISVISKASQIRGDIATCCFSHHLSALYIATDSLAVLQLQENATKHGLPSVSHNEPVTICLYNLLHDQIISCSESSDMKTWDLLTGQLIGEVRAAHGHSAVTCLVLDSSDNRLFTGSRDGSIKQWDYTLNSVSLMKTIKQESSESSRDGISDLTYAEHNNNGYIIPVSCDGQIRIFPDQHGAMKSDYECRQYTWSNNLRNEHEKGKLCLASSTSSLVATCNYNGEVLVWNLLSGDVFCHLTAPDVGDVDSGTGDLIINKIVFICSRIERKNESAVLIASGPRGNITFWNIVGGGKVFGRFAGSHYKSVVSDMAVSEDDSLLCAADQLFYVYIWNISHYALDGPEEQPPVLLHCWRAHLWDITRVIPVKKHNVIVTSSQDCTVKLWSIQGEHIVPKARSCLGKALVRGGFIDHPEKPVAGTFGQNKTWCIKTIKSSDDRSNSQKQPSNALCESKQDLEGEQEQLHRVSEVEATSLLIDDNDIAKELKERLKMSSPKQVELQQASGKMNAYKSLQICDLMSVSATIRKPNPAAELNDPYDLAF